MTKAEELKKIIDRGGDLIPFLKTLTKNEGKSLLPTLAKLRDKYYRRAENRRTKPGYGVWGEYHYPVKHINAIQLAGVVCADTVTQFRQNVDWSAERVLVSDLVIEQILPWHTPRWYSKTLNSRTSGSWVMDYEKMLFLMHQKYLAPTDELVTIVFERSACMITRGIGKDLKRNISYELWEQNPEIVTDHFWLLFEHNSAINNRTEREEHNWYKLIPDLIEKGKIPRDKVLQSCLLACTKGFNRTQTAWYYKLFKALQTSTEETICLQAEFITCLNSGESSAINMALTSIKSILGDQKFEAKNFVETTPMLLSMPIKGIVNNVLTILDKLASKYPVHKDEIAEAVIIALAHEDEKIQLKAAKHLVKNIKPIEEYIYSISTYQASFLSETKKVLAEFINHDEDPQADLVEDTIAEKLPILSEENKIPTYTTFDDIVFFLTQVNQNNEHWHPEQVLTVLPKLEKMITKENADKLSQAFTNAINMVSSNWEWGVSRTLSIYGYLINDFAEKIDKKYPQALKGRNKSIIKLRKIHASYAPPFKALQERKGGNLPPQRMILTQAKYCQNLMQKGYNIDILSIPTHLPGWIHPEILVDRIIALEAHEEPINLLDWQMAIMRLCHEYEVTPAFETKLGRIKKNTLRNVIRYFYQIDKLSKIEQSDIPYLLPAVLCIGNSEEKNKVHTLNIKDTEVLIQNYQWSHSETDYLGWDYNPKTREHYRIVKTKDVLYVDEYKYRRPRNKQTAHSNSTGILNKIKGMISDSSNLIKEVLEIPNLLPKNRVTFFDYYDFMSDGKEKRHIRNTVHLASSEAKRYLSMTPHHKQKYLSYALHYHMEQSGLRGEDDKRLIVAIVEYLISDWHKKDEDEITYAFLAASILTQHKIARQLVAELWIQAVDYGLFNSAQLGRIVGTLLSKNYAPLKRLTDLISSFIYNISVKHDKELTSFIQAIVIHMDDSPITSTKKLLEIFSELKLKHNALLQEAFKQKLEIWNASKSMTKVIKKISG